MKKILSTIMIVALMLSGFSVFAVAGVKDAVMPVLGADAVPAVYSETAPRFELKQTGDSFTIILDENITTGYSWIYTISDKAKVSYLGDEQTPSGSGLLGAGGTHAFSFKAVGEGVSTITFDYKRPWENEIVNTLRVLVYKTGEKVIVEEDGMVYAYDSTTQDSPKDVYYQDELIASDAKAQMIDGVMMIPLRSTLEKMGYAVKWNGEAKTVEISQGAQWTSIKIGENAYFKNKMAPAPLSAAPIIMNSRTLVPAEFFTVVFSRGAVIEGGNLKLSDNEGVIHSGYVKEINTAENGNMSITLTSDMTSDDIMLQTIIHTSVDTTYFNKKVIKGEQINVISSMIMTMSLPGQTSGYIVY